MVMLDKKIAQKRIQKFWTKLKANGKTWEEFLKERDAEESERSVKLSKAVDRLKKEKGK